MHALVSFMALAASPVCADEAAANIGYLVWAIPDHDAACATREAPYCPAEGDVVFFKDGRKVCVPFEWLAHTQEPAHCGIVVRLPDGCLALLEVAANCGMDFLESLR